MRDTDQWIAEQLPEIRSRLIRWCEINSGTIHQDGVAQVAAEVRPILEAIADEVALVSLPELSQFNDDGTDQTHRFADAIVAKKNVDAPLQVFLCIHLDTVYPPESPFQNVEVFQRDGRECLRGPGVADAKGGLAVLLATLEAIEHAAGLQSGWDQLGWRVVLNPDEEIGTPASASLLQSIGADCDFGLLYEPALPDGTLIGRRKGSANFAIRVRGRSAHAGREISAGRNAIKALCQAMLEIQKLHRADESVTVNLGRIAGGTALNVVPDVAVGRFNIRVREPDAISMVRESVAAVVESIAQQEGLSATLQGDFTSPPKLVDAPLEQLQCRIRNAGEQLRIPIRFESSGGVCDGNKLAAIGLPNVDTMGPVGGRIHSDQEYVDCDSLVERAQLGFRLLSNFVRQPEGFPSREHRHPS